MLKLSHERHQKTAPRYNSQSSINIWDPGFPQEAEISLSIIRSTMQTYPSIDSELLADWDLAWDYAPCLDLTFLVFFKCKHAHRPTCRGLTPLLKKKRADPMLSDPNLPRLPLPTATSLCSLFPFFLFQWPPSTHPSTPHLAWEPTPVVLPRHHHHIHCLHQNGLLWRLKWLHLNSMKLWLILCQAMQNDTLHHFKQTQIHWVHDT